MYLRFSVFTVARTALLGGALVTPVFADDLEDALGAFDEISTTVITAEKRPEFSKSPYGYLIGSIALSASYNFRDHEAINPDTGDTTDWQGLSKLRTKLFLEHNKSFNARWQTRVSGYAFYDSVFSVRDREN